MLNITTQKSGANYTVTLDPSKKTGKISNLLYGACMEDVNHELYGGIWSQMIFGESFEETPTIPESSGFRAAGGKWYLEEDGADDILCTEHSHHGPKLLITNTDCSEGFIEADVYSDGDAAGFIIKTSNASRGADSFDGYEISVLNNAIRLAKHQQNYIHISDTPCNVPQKTWIRLKAEFNENTMTAYVNGEKIASYTDPEPLNTGMIGFRSFNANMKYKNVKIAVNGEEKNVAFDTLKQSGNTAEMWESKVCGNITGRAYVITDGTYTGRQAQRLEITSGSGSLSVNNKGLNRAGMGFRKDRDYNGYIYAKSKHPLTVYTALENSDGSKRYAETSFTVYGDYNKYEFTLIPDTADLNGRFVIEIRDAGQLDIGYAFLEPGEWGLYKGLHVRRDVAEMLENQGITVLRFGGCMANARDYKWKKMTGKPEDRGSYAGWWYPFSSYGFGIIEFMDLCEALGVTYIPDFSSYETPEDMADFVHFAYGTDESDPWVRLRIEMGRKEPYGLKYIQIGNEDRLDLEFAARFNAVANAIWELNSEVILVAGDFDYKEVITDPNHITGSASGITTLECHKLILDNAAQKGRPVWFDIHFWSESGNDPCIFCKPALSLYDALKKISPDAETALCVFELNANAHHFERALCNALAIKFAENHSDVIKIMCSANSLQVQDQNDNSWDQGLVFMDNAGVWYQPAAYIDRIYLDAYLPYAIDIESTDDIHTEKFDITASASEDGKTVCVKILNRSGSEKSVDIAIPSFTKGCVKLTAVEYTDSMDAMNTADDHENSKPSDAVVTENVLTDGYVAITVPEYSIAVITAAIS